MNSIIDKIPNMNQAQLERLLVNANRKLETDPRAAAIVEACDVALRQYRPKVAFHRRAREVMEEVAARHGLLELENNVGKDGVLDGGGMRAGWLLADYYVGFKCPPFRRQAVLATVIVDRESDIEFWVYDLDHEKAEPGRHGIDWLPDEWDLGIPVLRTKDPDHAAGLFKKIIAPYAGGAA